MKNSHPEMPEMIDDGISSDASIELFLCEFQASHRKKKI